MRILGHALIATAATALLAFGCSGGETKADNPCGSNPCNPCAGKNPCGDNPCAGKNPCGANPCNPCGGNPCNPCGAGGSASNVAPEDQATLEEIESKMSAFKSWPQLNSERFESPTHGGHMVDIFANETAKPGFEAGSFDEGSIVVKEGYKGGKHNMTWVMVKREEGYDAGKGDWYYAMFTANGDLKLSGNSSNDKVNGACVNCHNGASDRDYVFGPGDYGK